MGTTTFDRGAFDEAVLQAIATGAVHTRQIWPALRAQAFQFNNYDIGYALERLRAAGRITYKGQKNGWSCTSKESTVMTTRFRPASDLRLRRLALGLRIVDLARLTGITATRLSQIERDEGRLVERDELREINLALAVPESTTRNK